MQLDPTVAQPLIEGYRQILLMAYSLKGLKGHRTPEERMLAVRRDLARERELLDEAVLALERRRGLIVDPAVVAALRTLEVTRWVYLRDLRHHSILLDPEGHIAFGVVGLSQPLRDHTGGPGFLLEAGVMAIKGHFICDGLLAEVAALHPGHLADYEGMLKELKAEGAFHKIPKPGFLRQPVEPSKAAPKTIVVVKPAAGAGVQAAASPMKDPKSKDPYREVIQLKVTLADIEPPIWRRLRVPSDYTLARLHKVIQAAFGWEDYHLHCFRIHGQDYAPVDSENEPGTQDERVALKRVGLRLRTKFRYEYDFGDGWEHQILVEGLLLLEEPAEVPACIGGQRACPPEDVGGPGGYQDMLDALRNPRDPRNKEFRLWLGDRSTDPEAFDLHQVNEAITKATSPRGAGRAHRS